MVTAVSLLILAFLLLAPVLTAILAYADVEAKLDLSSPVLVRVEHSELAYVYVGELLAISTTIVNGEDSEISFTVIVETRDEVGVTIDLQFQNGSLNSESQSEVSVLWRPEKASEYELRAFVISNFTNPQILTQVRRSQVSIEDPCNQPECRRFGDDISYIESYTKIQTPEQSFVGLFTYDFDAKCQSMTLQRCTPYKLDGVSVYTGAENLDGFVGDRVEVIGKKHTFELEGFYLEEIWPVRIKLLE